MCKGRYCPEYNYYRDSSGDACVDKDISKEVVLRCRLLRQCNKISECNINFLEHHKHLKDVKHIINIFSSLLELNFYVVIKLETGSL